MAVAFHARRPVDAAAWPEVRQDDTFARIEKLAASDPKGVYVWADRAQIPRDAAAAKVGRFFVGIRGGPPVSLIAG